MSRKSVPGGHAMPSVFVFALIGLFALMALLVIVTGTQAYRAVVERSDTHQNQRAALSYVVNRVRGADATDAIGIAEIDGRDVLTISQDADGDGYVTRFYVYDDMLTEQVSETGDTFYIEDGEPLTQARALTLNRDADGRLYVEIELASGETVGTWLAPRSA